MGKWAAGGWERRRTGGRGQEGSGGERGGRGRDDTTEGRRGKVKGERGPRVTKGERRAGKGGQEGVGGRATRHCDIAAVITRPIDTVYIRKPARIYGSLALPT